MKDRVPGAPGQYSGIMSPSEFQKLQSGLRFVVNLKRDDRPKVVGTPLNKLHLLPDDVATIACPGIKDPSVADAFRCLSGNGYGGKMPQIFAGGQSGNSIDALLDEYLARIDQTPNPVNPVRQVLIHDPDLQLGTYSVSTLYKSGTNTAIVCGIRPDGVMFQKKRSEGGWEPWEYLNPPMTDAVEYRTIYRCAGEPVYTMHIDFGVLPNNSHKKVFVPTPVKTLISIDGVVHTRTQNRITSSAFPLVSSGPDFSIIATATYEDRYIVINTNRDMSASKATFFIKYTKE